LFKPFKFFGGFSSMTVCASYFTFFNFFFDFLNRIACPNQQRDFFNFGALISVVKFKHTNIRFAAIYVWITR